MKHLMLFFFVLVNFTSLSAQNTNPGLLKYVRYLEKENTSAKDYILSLFKDHDVVVLCERNHGETTQYDLIYDVVSSDYFVNNVGHVFTEIGALDQRANVMGFTKTKFLTTAEKTKKQLELYRNIAYPIWEKTNFYDFIGRLNSLNAKLKTNRKIDLLPSNNRNPTLAETTSPENFKLYFNENWRKRDSLMATTIIKTFDDIADHEKRKKCLVIMNYRHAFSKTLSDGPEMNVVLKPR